MESNQEGRRGQSAVFSVFNIRRGVKTAGGGGVNVSMRTALIASLAAALAFAGCRGGDSEDDVIGNTPSGDSLKINPASVSIARGNARQFNATSGNSVVNWDIEGKHSDGTIIYPNGNLKIAKDETAEALTVVASLISDSYKKGTAVVTITPPAMPATEVNSFSNGTDTAGSAIDMIRVAKLSLQSFVMLELNSETETETVYLEDIGKDIYRGMLLDNTNSPAVVVIDGGNRAITLTSSGTDPVITVRTGVTLTLRNITFEGKNNNNAPLIKVDGGRLVLEDGARITGNTRTGGDQDANVSDGKEYVESKHGGGGGIVVHNGGSLEMIGNSEISGNTAGSVGGGVLVYGTDSKVTMTGSSKIGGNTASGAAGGGVYLSDGGALSMSESASITFNETVLGGDKGSGGGVLAIHNSSIEMHDSSKISNNTTAGKGGGIAICPGTANNTPSSLTMDGSSEISDNTSSKWGGGIYMFGSNVTVTMSENAGIKRNKAGEGGGGISASNDNSNDRTFTMNGGFISDNEAKSSYAGGVDACWITFNMTGGVISGNKAATDGGGVAVDGTFNMTDGTIFGNKASDKGGGVYVFYDTENHTGGIFEMTDGVIYGKNETGEDADGNDLKNTTASENGGAAVYVNDANKSEDTIYKYQ